MGEDNELAYHERDAMLPRPQLVHLRLEAHVSRTSTLSQGLDNTPRSTAHQKASSVGAHANLELSRQLRSGGVSMLSREAETPSILSCST
jgi:hypothetical protein